MIMWKHIITIVRNTWTKITNFQPMSLLNLMFVVYTSLSSISENKGRKQVTITNQTLGSKQSKIWLLLKTHLNNRTDRQNYVPAFSIKRSWFKSHIPTVLHNRRLWYKNFKTICTFHDHLDAKQTVLPEWTARIGVLSLERRMSHVLKQFSSLWKKQASL